MCNIDSCSGYCRICHPSKTTCLEYDKTDVSMLINKYDFATRSQSSIDLSQFNNFAGALNIVISALFQNTIVVKDLVNN